MKNKKLYRVDEGKVLFGVCTGFGEYFDIDPVLVRVGFAFFSVMGFGILAYILCAIIMPAQ